MSDLFDESAQGQVQSDVVAIYDYTDVRGELLFQVVRKVGKDFFQRRPDGVDRWIWNLDGTRRVPYHLPDVVAAAEAGGLVLVAEGEKDCDRLRAAGYTASCNPGGAGKWRDDYNQFFAGAEVVVIADKDLPGYRHAVDVARKLEAVAKSVVVVEAREGKDAADHLAVGYGIDDFVVVELEDLERRCRIARGARCDTAGAEAVVRISEAVLPPTDLGNARRLVMAHGDDLQYSTQLGTWLVWDGARWVEDLTGEVNRRAKAVVDGLLDGVQDLPEDKRRALTRHWLCSQGAARLKAIVDVAWSEPGIPVTVDQLDADPWALNVANGTVDLRTGNLRPHDRAQLHTKLAPVIYEAEAPAPRWRQFLNEIFDGDDEMTGFLQRFAGYSLTGDVSEQQMLFLYGAGANGKSTFLGALRAALGSYGMQLDPRVIMLGHHEEHPTGLTDLRGARFVATIETENGKRLAEALVKQLTGGDPIRARRMRCDFFEFMPSHKLWFAANHLPGIRGTDPAIWRRINLVPFNVTFDGDRKDKALPEKLAAEVNGILAWAVAGCLAWQEDGLQVPSSVQVATAEYRSSQDQLGRFLAECCQTGDTRSVASARLRERYVDWCHQEGEGEPLSAQAVGRELSRRGYDSTLLGKARTRTWIGLDVVAAQGGERL